MKASDPLQATWQGKDGQTRACQYLQAAGLFHIEVLSRRGISRQGGSCEPPRGLHQKREKRSRTIRGGERSEGTLCFLFSGAVQLSLHHHHHHHHVITFPSRPPPFYHLRGPPLLLHFDFIPPPYPFVACQ